MATLINFAVTGTIALTSGGLPINKNITISGPGPDQLSIDGNQAIACLRRFSRQSCHNLRSDRQERSVVGVLNEGTVTVTNCVLSGNSYDGLVQLRSGNGE